METLRHQDLIVINASPNEVYDLVSDVTRTGEWSPICKKCSWIKGTGPEVGARFSGVNERKGFTWESESEVIVADRGKELAWMVADGMARWSYRIKPVATGSELTETWEFLPEGIATFHERFGDKAQKIIDARTRDAHEGIPVTLQRIKAILEETSE